MATPQHQNSTSAALRAVSVVDLGAGSEPAVEVTDYGTLADKADEVIDYGSIAEPADEVVDLGSISVGSSKTDVAQGRR